MFTNSIFLQWYGCNIQNNMSVMPYMEQGKLYLRVLVKVGKTIKDAKVQYGSSYSMYLWYARVHFFKEREKDY